MTTDSDAVVTYEVRGYKDEAAFDAHQFTLVDESIPDWAEACSIGESALGDFGVVKVQSSDREEIEVLRRAKT